MKASFNLEKYLKLDHLTFSQSPKWNDWITGIFENARLIGCCVAASVFIGVCQLARTSPSYESKITVEVEQEASKILNIEDVRKQDLQRQDTLKTIEQNLQSRALFLRTVKNCQLAKDPDFLSQKSRSSLTEAQLADVLEGMVSVKLRRGTRLIDISVQHRSPQVAEKIAKGLVHEYIRQDFELRSGSNQTAFTFLIDEAERLRTKLQKSEEAIQEYEGSPQRNIAEIRKKSSDYEAELAQLSTRYKQGHPKIIYARAQLEQCKAFLTTAKQSEKTSNSIVSYDVLTREHDADRILYETVLKRMKETQITQSIAASTITISGPAVTSDHPVQPRKMSTLTFSLGSGLMFAFGLVLVRSAMNTSLRSVDTAEEFLKLPVLAAIPFEKNIQTAPHSALVAEDDPKSPIAEAFRSIRVTERQSQPKAILFAGATPSEGKTFCAANYAVTLAQQGIRTLLIDADLRKPSLGTLFPEANGASGVTQFLLGKKNLDEICNSTRVRNLSIIPAGNTAQNQTELLSSLNTKRLLKEALIKFDRVVLDSAPLLSVSDTLLLVDQVDLIYLVAHSSKTPRKAIQRAITMLERANVRPAGVILNQVPVARNISYYYDYSNKEDDAPDTWGLQPT